MQHTLQQIADRIKQANSVLIVTHMRPDGDAIGGALALSRALDFLKILNQVCVESDIPSNLTFLEGVEKVQKKPQDEFDLLVTVDCSDEQRLGGLSETFFIAKRKKIDTINIDHHVSNKLFAKYNYMHPCSANCMHICGLIEYMGAPIDKKTAEYLLVGLLTDSGNFSHDDVTEETMVLAGKLIKAGADICYCNEMLFKRQTKARAMLYARTMTGMRFYHDNRFAVIVVTKKNMDDCGADASMTEGFVDFPLNVDTVEIAASVLEVKRGQYKISLRSKHYADMNRLAGVYGGGGHVRAAGCMLFGEMEEVLDKISFTASQYLD
ncbi:MAG: bifunctional oligoribonuclease/PAP phosphatase NrnA [Clostridiales bacterium]|nr:bifunctional oligoribonuclease/PAP phosphatase NrnA [Clostridiales bacterium]